MSNVSLIDGHIDNANHCVCCHRVIYEDTQYCQYCGDVLKRKESEVEGE